MSGTVEFGGWPRPPRWVWAVAGVATVAVLAAFSPDGRLLALQVTARVGPGGRPTATQLAVAALAGGMLTAIPGTTIGAGIGVDLGWQPGSGRLVTEASLQDEWQISVWRPGDAHPHVAVTRTPAGSWPVVGPGPY